MKKGILLYIIMALAAIGTFLIFKGRSEGVYKPLIDSDKMPKFMEFLLVKKS